MKIMKWYVTVYTYGVYVDEFTIKYGYQVVQFHTREETERHNKKMHTVYCFLHRSETKCDLCEVPEVSNRLYSFMIYKN